MRRIFSRGLVHVIDARNCFQNYSQVQEMQRNSAYLRRDNDWKMQSETGSDKSMAITRSTQHMYSSREGANDGRLSLGILSGILISSLTPHKSWPPSSDNLLKITINFAKIFPSKAAFSCAWFTASRTITTASPHTCWAVSNCCCNLRLEKSLHQKLRNEAANFMLEVKKLSDCEGLLICKWSRFQATYISTNDRLFRSFNDRTGNK